jgi:deoxyribodipyrimidine photo-lyase
MISLSSLVPSRYDKLTGAKGWAQETLAVHSADKRDWLYTLEQFERAETHDPLWNACQKQMYVDGKVHGYMR